MSGLVKRQSALSGFNGLQGGGMQAVVQHVVSSGDGEG